MPLEHEFLKQRLALVERQLQRGPSDMVYQSTGRGRQRTSGDSGIREERHYKREARLLRHMLNILQEGQVLSILGRWRQFFGRFFEQHREQYRKQQEDYDAWWQLPPHERGRIPQPARPPVALYTGQDGQEWVIDDYFLQLLDDLHKRLSQWMSEE